MRTFLEVEAETAKRLSEIAKARKISVQELLVASVPGLAEFEASGTGMGERLENFEKWAGSFPADVSPLADEAVSREAIYRDR